MSAANDPERLFVLTGVAIVKDEAAYLEEGLAYHLNLGFEHFFVFDNGSRDATPEILAPFIKYGYVTYIHWPLFPGQSDAYNYAVRLCGHACEWMAFFDIDEFFVLKEHRTIPQLLAGLQDCDQLLVFWKFFGHSGHHSRPPGLVIENYTACEDGPSFVVKSIVRPQSVIMAHVHNCTTHSGLTRNDRGDLLRENWAHPRELVSEELIRINHYFTRSYAEYVAKIQRGQVDGRAVKKSEPFEKFDYPARDDRLLSQVDATRQRIAVVKGLAPQPHRYGALTNIGSISNPRNFTLLSQALAGALAPDGELVRHTFGTGVTFRSGSDQERIAGEFQKELGNRARAANATALRFAGVQARNIEHVDGGIGIAFRVTGADPLITLKVDDAHDGGFVWLAFLLETPERRELECSVSGTDVHRLDITQDRRLGSLGPGLIAGFIMLNDVPLRAHAVRLRLGPASGDYRMHNLAIFKSY